METEKKPNINIIASLASLGVLLVTLVIVIPLIFIERFLGGWPFEIWGVIFIICCGGFAVFFIILYNNFNKKTQEDSQS